MHAYKYTYVVNYNTVVAILYCVKISMDIEFYVGLAVGLFLALLSIFIYTKIQSNQERQELAATL